MNTATRHKNKLLLLGVVVALVSMVVSSDFFELQTSAPNLFDAIAAKWDFSLKPGKLIHGGFNFSGLLTFWK